jgi:hypothetical protein
MTTTRPFTICHDGRDAVRDETEQGRAAIELFERLLRQRAQEFAEGPDAPPHSFSDVAKVVSIISLSERFGDRRPARATSRSVAVSRLMSDGGRPGPSSISTRRSPSAAQGSG